MLYDLFSYKFGFDLRDFFTSFFAKVDGFTLPAFELSVVLLVGGAVDVEVVHALLRVEVDPTKSIFRFIWRYTIDINILAANLPHDT